jgi:tight adherence protein C
MASLTFLVICLLSTGVMAHLVRARQQREMLKKIRPVDSEYSTNEKHANPLDLSDRSGNVITKFLSVIGGKTNPGRSTEHVDIKLKFLRAGFRGKNVPTVFYGVKFLLAVVLPMVFLVIIAVFFRALNTSQMLFYAIFLSLLGLFFPDVWLRRKTARRREKIVKGFPDALDLLVVCVEAGMGLDAAIHRVGEELLLSNPELSSELKLLNLELRAGKPRHSALRNLAERTNVDEVNSLVTLLIQTDRFGTSVAQALRVFSDGFRTTRYQRAEEFAAKIGTKLIFPLVLFIFPSMLIVMLGPVAIQVRRTFYG